MNKTESLELRVKELEAKGGEITSKLYQTRGRLSEALEVLKEFTTDSYGDCCECGSPYPKKGHSPSCRLSKLINSNKGE